MKPNDLIDTTLCHYDREEPICLEKEWPSSINRYVLEAVPPGSRVLELGCATGYYGRFLKEQKQCRLAGIERDAASARKAEPYYETMVVGNLDDPKVLDGVKGPFDVLFLVGVLEHLQDPLACLRRLRLLTTSRTQVILTLPNIAHWSIRYQLLRGRFEYTDYGILDRTHLRFFTLKSARALLAEAGLLVRTFQIDPDMGIPKLNGLLRRMGSLGVRLQQCLYFPWPNLFGYQFYFQTHWPDEQGRDPATRR